MRGSLTFESTGSSYFSFVGATHSTSKEYVGHSQNAHSAFTMNGEENQFDAYLSHTNPAPFHRLGTKQWKARMV